METKIKDLASLLPYTVGKGVSLDKATQMMREHRCHHLPVLDGGKLVGVISDRDITFARGLDKSTETLIEEIMMEEPIVVNSEDNLSKVLEKMLKYRINSVIVSASDNQPWGIFTTTDLIKYIINRNQK